MACGMGSDIYLLGLGNRKIKNPGGFASRVFLWDPYGIGLRLVGDTFHVMFMVRCQCSLIFVVWGLRCRINDMGCGKWNVR
jgi:hypothetical protein